MWWIRESEIKIQTEKWQLQETCRDLQTAIEACGWL